MLALLQRLLQRLFLRAEAVFNAIFGERLNPLYHLGAISYWLFWVVLASGLYLYAFFDTSVTEAYRSVEQLTLDPAGTGFSRKDDAGVPLGNERSVSANQSFSGSQTWPAFAPRQRTWATSLRSA